MGHQAKHGPLANTVLFLRTGSKSHPVVKPLKPRNGGIQRQEHMCNFERPLNKDCTRAFSHHISICVVCRFGYAHR